MCDSVSYMSALRCAPSGQEFANPAIVLGAHRAQTEACLIGVQGDKGVLWARYSGHLANWHPT